MFVRVDPQPQPSQLPEPFPSPFHPRPHALAAAAAADMQVFLATLGRFEDELFRGRFGGKMFGVLVVRREDGQIGYLRGFAGMLGGGPLVEGFVPPVYDVEAFHGLWDAGGAEIAALDREMLPFRSKAESEPAAARQLRKLSQAQTALSRRLHAQLHDTYQLTNAAGQTRSLRALFEPRAPPGGAGDCAAPKLVAHAYALGMRPIALAEFWWGGSPPAGGRQHGVFYPACRGRCATILPFMLEGLACEPAPDVGMKAIAQDEPRRVYEDDAIVVVDKPCGLLSVPGRGPRRRDSVEYRLQQRADPGEEGWPRLVHRLDLATSGLLIAAKHKPAYIALQRQFSGRSLDKRYVALVRGAVEGDAGIIDLPLTRDLEDRPRQMHDPVRGKPSTTRWEVLERGPDTTRVALYPKTGRTHQLRLHAAHPQGLDAPILGDQLYGYGGVRLMLHAEGLSFEHPVTGAAIELRSPCPF